MTEQTSEQTAEDREPFVTAYNTTSGPLVIDQAGRTLGGAELGTVRRDRQPSKGLIESRQLVNVEHRDDPDVSNEAGLVFAETARQNEVAAHGDQPATTSRRRRSSGPTEEA